MTVAFSRLLMDNFYAMAPIIYTPTVGWACSHFSHLYRRPRGMYFCKYDMGEMASMIYNWESDQVKICLIFDDIAVVTQNSYACQQNQNLWCPGGRGGGDGRVPRAGAGGPRDRRPRHQHRQARPLRGRGGLPPQAGAALRHRRGHQQPQAQE